MPTKIVDLWEVKSGDRIYSIYNKPLKIWVRFVRDHNGDTVNVHKLFVERSLGGSNCNWIICLDNVDPDKMKHIFFFHLNNYKFRVFIN